MIRLILLLFAAATLSVARVGDPGGGPLTLKYLGTAGWEISDGRTTLLVDPYLSRLHITSPNDDVLPGDTRQQFTQADAAESDTATIDKHIQRADFILVTHTHPTMPSTCRTSRARPARR